MAKPRKSSARKSSRLQTPQIARSKRAKEGSLQPPRIVFANVSPHSVGGVSMFDAGAQINSQTVANFTSEPDIMARAVARLQEVGFQVLQVTESTINIAGPPKLYERAFGSPIIVKQKEVIKEGAREDLAEFLDSPSSELPGLMSVRGTEFEQLIEGVAIEEPRYYMAANMFPPSAKYWHLDVPGDVSLACNADRAHRGLITGKDVKVAMVDSGWFRHPFFVERGYRVSAVTLGPGAANPMTARAGTARASRPISFRRRPIPGCFRSR